MKTPKSSIPFQPETQKKDNTTTTQRFHDNDVSRVLSLPSEHTAPARGFRCSFGGIGNPSVNGQTVEIWHRSLKKKGTNSFGHCFLFFSPRAFQCLGDFGLGRLFFFKERPATWISLKMFLVKLVWDPYIHLWKLTHGDSKLMFCSI